MQWLRWLADRIRHRWHAPTVDAPDHGALPLWIDSWAVAKRHQLCASEAELALLAEAAAESLRLRHTAPPTAEQADTIERIVTDWLSRLRERGFPG